MFKYLFLSLLILFIVSSCKKDVKEEEEVEKLFYPGRVKSIGSQLFYYDSNGNLTKFETVGDDWTTFYWDFTAQTLRVLDEGDLSGIKSNITYNIDGNNYMLQSVDGTSEKFIYDSLMQLKTHISSKYDTTVYEWSNGNVISETTKTYSLGGDNNLDYYYTRVFEYMNILETRNFGIKYFPKGISFYGSSGLLCKNLCSKKTITNNLTSEITIFNYSYEFNSNSKISKMTISGAGNDSYTYSYY